MKKLFSLILAISFLLCLTGCNFERDNNGYSYFKEYITLSTRTNNQTAKQYKDMNENLDELLFKFEKKVSLDYAQSEINHINQSNGEWIEISNEIYNLLEKAQQIYIDTDGSFNPAMLPLTKLWGFSHDNEEHYFEDRLLPDDKIIQEALLHTDFLQLELRDNKVRKLDKEMQIDLGGIAKGWMVDLVKTKFKELDVDGMIVSMSNIYAIGKKSNNEIYKIGITNPRKEETDDSFFAITSLEDTSIVTSGDYEKYFIHNGERYCHIIDKTGYPTREIIAVSVKNADCYLADAYATALMTMSMGEAIEFAETRKLNVLLINKDNKYKTIGNFELIEINNNYEKYE